MREMTYGKIREVAMYVNQNKERLNDKKYQSKETLNEVAAQLLIDELKASNKNIKTRNYKENFYIDISMTKEQIIGLLQVIETTCRSNCLSSTNLNTLLTADGFISSLLIKHPQLSKIFLYHSSFFEGFTVKNKHNEKIIDASSNNKISDYLLRCRHNYCESYILPALEEGELYKVTIILGKSFAKNPCTVGNEEYFHHSLKTLIQHIDVIQSYYFEFIFIRRILNYGLSSIDRFFQNIINRIHPQGRDDQTMIAENICFLSNLFNICTFLQQYLAHIPKLSEFLSVLYNVIENTPDEKLVVEFLDVDTIAKIAQEVLTKLLNSTDTWSIKYIGTILEEII